jgi:hypothetical protein
MTVGSHGAKCIDESHYCSITTEDNRHIRVFQFKKKILVIKYDHRQDKQEEKNTKKNMYRAFNLLI